MDLSIIIPCYNLEGYIEKCISSILCQSVKDYLCEIIFVNDCCTDKTEELIKKSMSKVKHWNWKIVQSTEHSVGGARNVGLPYATGDYIWFVDGDDWLADSQAVVTILTEFYKNPNIEIVKFNWESQKFEWKGEVMVWQYVFSKKSIEGLSFVTTMPAEDGDFMRQVKERHPFIHFISARLYWYNHPREGSVMELLNKYKLHTLDWSKVE